MTPEKERYIERLADSLARGEVLRAVPDEEERAARALLRRAGIRIPRRRLGCGVVEARKRYKEIIKEEQLSLVRSVAIARAVWRLVSDQQRDYGRKLVEGEEPPLWFKDIARECGASYGIDYNEIPGYNLAFSNTEKAFLEKAKREAGLVARIE